MPHSLLYLQVLFYLFLNRRKLALNIVKQNRPVINVLNRNIKILPVQLFRVQMPVNVHIRHIVVHVNRRMAAYKELIDNNRVFTHKLEAHLPITIW